jgi:pilus assembly protein CpaF
MLISLSVLHTELLAYLETRGIALPTQDEVVAWANIRLAEEEGAEQTTITQTLLDRLFGWGPLTPLLADDRLTEIMVNGPDQIFVESDGKITQANIRFENNEELLGLINRMVAQVGRRIDTASPMVDARLPDGSRINAIIPPLSLKGPVLTIRRFPKIPPTLHMLVERGTLTSNAAEFLQACIQARLNIVVSGGTGSGKTTTLNALASTIGAHERLVTVEDSAEMKITHPHLITLESRPANVEGSGEVSVRGLVKNALRMRPDRIIVGEIRSGEALDMLQAMNTGHQGSLTTVHANAPLETLLRIETMALMADIELPLFAIRQQISQAIHMIVYQERRSDGSRKVMRIELVTPKSGQEYMLTPLYVFDSNVRSLKPAMTAQDMQGHMSRFGISVEAAWL